MFRDMQGRHIVVGILAVVGGFLVGPYGGASAGLVVGLCVALLVMGVATLLDRQGAGRE